MIAYIQSFWLIFGEIFLPLMAFYYAIQFHRYLRRKTIAFFKEKKSLREKRESDKDFQNEIKLDLSKRQLLAAIAHVAKGRYVYMQHYDQKHSMEILMTEYAEFFRFLGFK